MVTNPRDLVERDMAYGQAMMFVTTPDDDMKGNIDYVIGNLRIAYRRRRYKLNRWGELSIRAWRKSGAETEMSKIITGKAKAKLYIWEFLDCWVIATVEDVTRCLRNQNKHYTKLNVDGITKACYIKIHDINHLLIWKIPNNQEVTAK